MAVRHRIALARVQMQMKVLMPNHRVCARGHRTHCGRGIVTYFGCCERPLHEASRYHTPEAIQGMMILRHSA